MSGATNVLNINQLDKNSLYAGADLPFVPTTFYGRPLYCQVEQKQVGGEPLLSSNVCVPLQNGMSQEIVNNTGVKEFMSLFRQFLNLSSEFVTDSGSANVENIAVTSMLGATLTSFLGAIFVKDAPYIELGHRLAETNTNGDLVIDTIKEGTFRHLFETMLLGNFCICVSTSPVCCLYAPVCVMTEFANLGDMLLLQNTSVNYTMLTLPLNFNLGNVTVQNIFESNGPLIISDEDKNKPLLNYVETLFNTLTMGGTRKLLFTVDPRSNLPTIFTPHLLPNMLDLIRSGWIMMTEEELRIQQEYMKRCPTNEFCYPNEYIPDSFSAGSNSLPDANDPVSGLGKFSEETLKNLSTYNSRELLGKYENCYEKFKAYLDIAAYCQFTLDVQSTVENINNLNVSVDVVLNEVTDVDELHSLLGEHNLYQFAIYAMEKSTAIFERNENGNYNPSPNFAGNTYKINGLEFEGPYLIGKNVTTTGAPSGQVGGDNGVRIQLPEPEGTKWLKWTQDGITALGAQAFIFQTSVGQYLSETQLGVIMARYGLTKVAIDTAIATNNPQEVLNILTSPFVERPDIAGALFEATSDNPDDVTGASGSSIYMNIPQFSQIANLTCCYHGSTEAAKTSAYGAHIYTNSCGSTNKLTRDEVLVCGGPNPAKNTDTLNISTYRPTRDVNVSTTSLYTDTFNGTPFTFRAFEAATCFGKMFSLTRYVRDILSQYNMSNFSAANGYLQYASLYTRLQMVATSSDDPGDPGVIYTRFLAMVERLAHLPDYKRMFLDRIAGTSAVWVEKSGELPSLNDIPVGTLTFQEIITNTNPDVNKLLALANSSSESSILNNFNTIIQNALAKSTSTP